LQFTFAPEKFSKISQEICIKILIKLDSFKDFDICIGFYIGANVFVKNLEN